MQLFSREIMDYIDRRFQAHYCKRTSQMSIAEANMLIDYVSGPVPIPHGLRASDYTKPRVSGGGKTRPTRAQVDLLFNKVEKQYDLDSAWDGVFENLITRCENEPDAKKIIEYTYEERLYDSDICEKMNISRTTYYEYRSTILSRAGLLAVQAGILKF